MSDVILLSTVSTAKEMATNPKVQPDRVLCFITEVLKNSTQGFLTVSIGEVRGHKFSKAVNLRKKSK